MDFTIPDEFRLIQETVRRFIRDRLRPLEEAVDVADDVDPATMARLRHEAVDLGFYGYNMPDELGGPGLPLMAQSLIDRETGRTTMPLAEAVGRIPETLRFCNEQQRRAVLPAVMAGEKTVAFALTEPEAGSDLGAITTRAQRRNGHWQLDGVKHFISHGDTADYVIVLAVTDPAEGLKGRFSAFLVEAGTEGFTATHRFRKLGWHGYHLAALAFDGCRLPDEALIGRQGEGFLSMMAIVNPGRLNIAGRCVGMADDLLHLAAEYAESRRTFGRRLAERDSVQFTLADIATELKAAELLVDWTAWLGDQGSSDFPVAASQAKLWAAEMVGRAADSVLQLFGGAGYMADLPIERMYRDARAFRIGEGTSEILRLQVARAVLRRARGR